jgi:AAA+ ATPase superfamily predicted ATPase
LYFDPRPKIRRKDLYDRDEELGRFSDSLAYASLIVITGLRRSGKTSFMNVALAGCGCPSVVLDMRGLPFNPSYGDVVRRLEAAFKRIDRRWFSDFAEALRHVRGVSVLGNEFSLEWGRAGVDLPELFGRIDSWAAEKGVKFLIGFDEIQLVRGDKWITRFFAHVVDSYRNVVLVVTGSEVGVMFDFLGFDKADSPLYGRHFVQIHIDAFSGERAKDFLVQGFRQIEVVAPLDVIEYAVGKLDGVAGWLTLFGVRCRDRKACSVEVADEVVSEGGRLAREEALKLTHLSRRYGVVLNFLAKVELASWSQVKAVLERKEMHSLTHAAVSNVLKTLANLGVLVKADEKYRIADVLLVQGVLEEALPE